MKTLISKPAIYMLVCLALPLLIANCGLSEKTKKLYTAIEKKDRGEVERLLNKGADVNASTSGKVTYSPLLYCVVFSNDTEIAKILLEHGAKINARNNLGCTALHHAAMGGDHRKMVEFLIANGADLSIKDDFGKRPLDFAQEELSRQENYEKTVDPEMKAIVVSLSNKSN